MKAKSRKFEYLEVIKYALSLCGFILLNCIESTVYPYSIALYVALICSGASLIVTPILFLLSFLVLGCTSLLLSVLIPALLFVIIMLVYRGVKSKPSYEVLLFTMLSLIGFVLLDNLAVTIYRKLIVCAIILILTIFCLIGVKAISKKGLKHKFGFEEYVAVAILTCAIGLGLCNLISPYLWKGVALLILLLVCYLYKTGAGALVSAVLGCSLALYYSNINYVSIFLLYNLIISCSFTLSRYLGAILVMPLDYLIERVFSIYGGYSTIDFIYLLCACLIFCIIPSKPLNNLKEKLYCFREKQLSRQTINRNRLMVSNRLYELSTVFSEMANAFTSFSHNNITSNKAKEGIQEQILCSICRQCDNYHKCKRHEKVIERSVGKMADIGFAKGKLSFIDLNKEIVDICIHPNDILYTINKLLADYRSYQIENANLNNGRDMIASEAVGISEILRDLALETGTLLKYQNRLERLLSQNLFKCGFMVSEILIYGEDENVNVSLILTMNEFSLPKLQAVISKTLNCDVTLRDKSNIGEDKCFLSFCPSGDYDAVFGIASRTKDGSKVSGDTHSVVRLSGDKFLVALSDGMGSGDSAQNISSTSLSLIESFYRAGLNSNLILNTVNKLLSINTEDNFTALDISVIDLRSCSADFIKYGSPYAFIISENGIRIIEGNTLPLGIIEELKPSVCNATLSDGDIILLLTDGISDAFSSSSEVIDFLRSQPAKNPQALVDSMLSRALSLTNGTSKDDMTALAVRVFKRTKCV